METQLIDALQGGAGNAGLLMAVWFTWSKLQEAARSIAKLSRQVTIIMTKMGVHDADDDNHQA